jgi:hypothetical protein
MERTPLSQNNTKPPTKKVQDEIFAKREKSDVEGEKKFPLKSAKTLFSKPHRISGIWS